MSLKSEFNYKVKRNIRISFKCGFIVNIIIKVCYEDKNKTDANFSTGHLMLHIFSAQVEGVENRSKERKAVR